MIRLEIEFILHVLTLFEASVNYMIYLLFLINIYVRYYDNRYVGYIHQ